MVSSWIYVFITRYGVGCLSAQNLSKFLLYFWHFPFPFYRSKAWSTLLLMRSTARIRFDRRLRRQELRECRSRWEIVTEIICMLHHLHVALGLNHTLNHFSVASLTLSPNILAIASCRFCCYSSVCFSISPHDLQFLCINRNYTEKTVTVCIFKAWQLMSSHTDFCLPFRDIIVD